MSAAATCGHGGRTAGILEQRRYCDWCWRNLPETRRPCSRCANPDHLGLGELCQRCRAHDRIQDLFNDDVLRRQPALTALRDHLLTADPRYILGLIHRRTSWRRLVQIAANPTPVTHDDLDQLGTPRSVAQVRSLLVDLGVLPARDERLVDLERWTTGQVTALASRFDRLAVTQFARWRQQRRRRAIPMTATVAANDKREIRLVIGLLHAIELAGYEIRTTPQEVVDQWLAAGPSAATRVRQFLGWCRTSGTNITLVPLTHSRPDFLLGGRHAVSNEAALATAIHDETLDPRFRLAIVLIVVYGIRVHRIAALKLDAIQVREDVSVVTLGSVDLQLPAVTRPWIHAIRAGVSVKRRLGGRDTDPVWVFPGYCHNYHVVPSSLATQLRPLGVDPRAGHRAASGALITQMPPAVVARILGVSIATASAWARLTGTQPDRPVSREFG